MTRARAKLHRMGGTGPDLLLIHGFGSDRYSWAANAPVLADAASVWAVELPGHGQAPDVVGDGSARTLAHAVAEHLHRLAGPAVVVGHSLGGAVALYLAQIAPQAVRHLVLIAPAGLGPGLDHDFLQAFPALETPAAAQALLERLVERKRLIAPVMVSHVLGALQVPARRAALATIARALAAMPQLSLPPAIPTDLIWGDADTINPQPPDPPSAPGFLRLAGIGHLPQVETASKVNAVIRAALAG